MNAFTVWDNLWACQIKLDQEEVSKPGLRENVNAGRGPKLSLFAHSKVYNIGSIGKHFYVCTT